MEHIQSYVLAVGGFLIFQGLLEGILPSHVSRKYIQLVMGAVFLLILVQPLLQIFGGDMEQILWEEQVPHDDYADRVSVMTGEEYARVLKQEGLPEEWQGRWKLADLVVECTENGVPERIRVKLQTEEVAESGTIEPIRIDLGGIGAAESVQERELAEELAAHWGMAATALQVQIM